MRLSSFVFHLCQDLCINSLSKYSDLDPNPDLLKAGTALISDALNKLLLRRDELSDPREFKKLKRSARDKEKILGQKFGKSFPKSPPLTFNFFAKNIFAKKW